MNEDQKARLGFLEAWLGKVVETRKELVELEAEIREKIQIHEIVAEAEAVKSERL